MLRCGVNYTPTLRVSADWLDPSQGHNVALARRVGCVGALGRGLHDAVETHPQSSATMQGIRHRGTLTLYYHV